MMKHIILVVFVASLYPVTSADTLECGPNEEQVECPNVCQSDYCPTSENENSDCVKPEYCPEPECRCELNYRRVSPENRTCIPIQQCPPFDCSARPNEKYVACPPWCPTDACGTPRFENKCPTRIGTRLICNPKCQCIDQYARKDGVCVPFADCYSFQRSNENPCSCNL